MCFHTCIFIFQATDVPEFSQPNFVCTFFKIRNANEYRAALCKMSSTLLHFFLSSDIYHFGGFRRIAKKHCHLRHVCVCVHMEQLYIRWTDSYEILHLNIFRKSGYKIQVSLKSDNNNGSCTWRPVNVSDNILLSCSCNLEIFQNNVVEKITTHILCLMTCFRKLWRYELMWKNLIQPDRP